RRLDDVIVVSHELNRRAPGWVTTFGYGLLFFAAALALAAHLNTFGQNRLRLLRVQVGIFSAIVLFALAAKAFLLFISASAYWIPAATIPLWVATSYDRRTAFMVAIVCAVVAAVLADFDVLILSVMLIQG